MSDFWEPETTTSTPHSSWGRSTAASPETASTHSTASRPTTTSFSARTSWTTPVDVTRAFPAPPNLPRRGHERELAWNDEVGDGRFHPPRARGGEAQYVVAGLEHGPQPLQDPLVHLDERRRAVVQDRLRHHLAHRRGQRRRPGRHQILLVEYVRRSHRRRQGYGYARRGSPLGH